MMSLDAKPITPLVMLFSSSIAIAFICALVRFRLVRHLKLVDHFDGRIRLCFLSEEYAIEFARLNCCGLD